MKLLSALLLCSSLGAQTVTLPSVTATGTAAVSAQPLTIPGVQLPDVIVSVQIPKGASKFNLKIPGQAVPGSLVTIPAQQASVSVAVPAQTGTVQGQYPFTFTCAPTSTPDVYTCTGILKVGQ